MDIWIFVSTFATENKQYKRYDIMEKTFYRPFVYFDDGTSDVWGTFDCLRSNQYFESREELEAFMEMNGYSSWDYEVREINESELDKDNEILDAFGEIVSHIN